MTSKFLSRSSAHMAAPFTKPANTRERGPGLWHGGGWGGNSGLRSVGRVKGWYCVRIRSHPFFANLSPFRQPHLAPFVPKGSCFRVLVESHLLTFCPDCKLPLRMATIFLKGIPNPSFS